jgi:fermentation-respiration switch protein FrsA (DUF1100 family)
MKLFLIILGCLGFVYFSLGAGLRLWQNRLIFKPSSYIQKTPNALDLPYQDVYINLPKNESIHGWWIPSPYGSKKVVLHCHGNGFNVSYNLGQARIFYELGYSVFLFDYRGYGLSQGKFPTEKQVYEDVQIAWNYLVKTRKIKPENITVYGHSLGGAIALNLAYHYPQMNSLIIESSFTSMGEMAEYIGYSKIFPMNLILTHKFDSINKIKNINIPILFIHGELDQTVPSWMSEKLYETANEPRELFLVTEADHNNVATVSGMEYLDIIQYFVKLLTIADTTTAY